MNYSVRSISVGSVEVPAPEIFWMEAFDKWLPLELQVGVIQGNGITAIVNTGPPTDLSPINDMWTSILGPRAELKRTDDQEIVRALSNIGISPEEVTHVLITPFQLYTTGNIPLFTNAKICLSKRGWVHYHTTHSHPHDSRWHSISPEVIKYLVTDAWDNVRLLEDEDEIAPGLRTWFSGTHHRASIAIDVDTADGTVCISDSFFYYENVEENRMLGIGENMYEGISTYQRARESAKHFLPLYDPKVQVRYSEGIISRGHQS
jgi:hypothetical protein